MKSLTALPLLLMAASLAHADSVRWYVDAISPQNTLDYLVEAAGPPFPGYDYQIFTDLAVWFPYDTLNAISCFHPFSDCAVAYMAQPAMTVPEMHPPMDPHGPPMHPPIPPTATPEGPTLFMCAGGLLLLAGRLRRRYMA